MSAVRSTSSTVDQLRRQLTKSQLPSVDRPVISTGMPCLDSLLPQQGLPAGSVIEWISEAPGMRATTVAMQCAAGYLERSGVMAVVDPLHSFHATCAEHLGIPLSRLLIVRPQLIKDRKTVGTGIYGLSQNQRTESLWALEQLARCAGVRVVLTWIDRLSSMAQRRLQLAVEQSGVTVFLIRPAQALRQTSWADLRFHIQSVSDHTASASRSVPALSESQTTVRLVRSRNFVQNEGAIVLKYQEETGRLTDNSGGSIG